MSKFADSLVGIRVNSGTGAGSADVGGVEINGVSALLVASITEWKIHRGKEYLVSALWEGIADGSEVVGSAKTGGKDVHVSPLVAATGNAIITSYAGITVADYGTVLSPSNLNANYPVSVTTGFYKSPTLSDYGAERVSYLLPGGEKKAGAGVKGLGATIIPGGGVEFALAVKNISGAPATISMQIQFHEE
jgi:hypothetical protein